MIVTISPAKFSQKNCPAVAETWPIIDKRLPCSSTEAALARNKNFLPLHRVGCSEIPAPTLKLYNDIQLNEPNT